MREFPAAFFKISEEALKVTNTAMAAYKAGMAVNTRFLQQKPIDGDIYDVKLQNPDTE